MSELNITREFTRTVHIQFVEGKDKIYFKDYNAVRYVWGAETASTDMRFVHKEPDGRLFIYKDKLKERLGKLKQRRDRIDAAIKILEQFRWIK